MTQLFSTKYVVLNGIVIRCIEYCDKQSVTYVGGETGILSVITRLKSSLGNIIEPDFGLLDQLLSLGVLTRPELADVRCEKTVYRRNAVLLDLLSAEQQCDLFLKALQQTEQQHIVNFIRYNRGQRQSDVVTHPLA